MSFLDIIIDVASVPLGFALNPKGAKDSFPHPVEWVREHPVKAAEGAVVAIVGVGVTTAVIAASYDPEWGVRAIKAGREIVDLLDEDGGEKNESD